jgi:hypothetical protein
MNYGMANRVGPVFSEKTKNASTHYEIEYVVLIKSKIFVHSQPPRARANHQHAMAEKFSMQRCWFAVSGSFSTAAVHDGREKLLCRQLYSCIQSAVVLNI